MAAKKRPADDDDDEPPLRKRRRDEEDDEDEEAPAPKRRRPRDEDDEDDDDRPAKRRPSKDEEDDARPAKRRRPKDDEEDEDEDDEPAPRKRGKRRDEEDEDEDDEDEEDKKPKGKPAEDDNGEAAYAAWQKKLVIKRQRLLVLNEGLQLIKKRVNLLFFSAFALIGMFGLGIFFSIIAPGPETGFVVALLLGVTLAVVGLAVPIMGIVTATRFKKGPAKLASHSLLTVELVNNPAMLIFGPSFYLSLIFQLFYMRAIAEFLKDKLTFQRIKGIIIHHFVVDFAAGPIIAVAAFFLVAMGKPGFAIIGVLVLTYIILFAKGFVDIKKIVDLLSTTVTKRVTAMDKPDW
jgi:hypothetical protein